ncbi:MAG: peptidoglycan DD-metalloendopeptidase family protein [Acaryochloris sp. RU_4_1]|nr:peptidoglycan DD-metalloendopeptidase family protein [Acaryochloris sp. RU_4_1]NJR53390.1 peptidoglycan DD-metalloendopeptidase family protein [Acaryochloris sp. CRU_2_0]
MRSLLPVPKRFRILITLTGQRSIKFSISSLPVLLSLAVMTVVPLAWAGSTLSALRQSHNQLSESATEVLEELDVLDEEIEQLRQRAGLPKQQDSQAKLEINQGKGGIAIILDTQQQLQVAKARLPALTSQLKQQVKPALEKTLQAEAVRNAARPQGKPTKGKNPISSDFGLRPGPFGGQAELHDGIDLLGDYGAPIYATANGKVQRAEYTGGYGYHVLIQHGDGYQTLYAHLSKLAITPNVKVKRGQLIGYMGSTGRSTGTHLHYSIYRHERAIDPKLYMISQKLQP